jgi:hypothetical protein
MTITVSKGAVIMMMMMMIIIIITITTTTATVLFKRGNAKDPHSGKCVLLEEADSVPHNFKYVFSGKYYAVSFGDKV